MPKHAKQQHDVLGVAGRAAIGNNVECRDPVIVDVITLNFTSIDINDRFTRRETESLSQEVHRIKTQRGTINQSVARNFIHARRARPAPACPLLLASEDRL